MNLLSAISGISVATGGISAIFDNNPDEREKLVSIIQNLMRAGISGSMASLSPEALGALAPNLGLPSLVPTQSLGIKT